MADVYAAHFKYVWRCLRSLGVPDTALDDAVQEVFLVVQRKLGAFDGACDTKTWLYAIVLRISRRYRAEAARHAERFTSHEPGSDDEALASSIAADLRNEVEKNERLALAQRALAGLDDAKREVFVFACIEGMSAPEIATLVGVPLNTVYSRLRAARQAFAEAVASLSVSPPPEGQQHD
ncbi:MAG TPA: RNA polymerase sigma factor [Polyangiaceae bacterium]|nr:RNA polymerase sigma factor [Polyangiaceae bacterium]